MSRKNTQSHFSQSHPCIDLTDILELIYNDMTYSKCWRCKSQQFVKDLQLQITQEGWQITCLSCLRRKYLS